MITVQTPPRQAWQERLPRQVANMRLPSSGGGTITRPVSVTVTLKANKELDLAFVREPEEAEKKAIAAAIAKACEGRMFDDKSRFDVQHDAWVVLVSIEGRSFNSSKWASEPPLTIELVAYVMRGPAPEESAPSNTSHIKQEVLGVLMGYTEDRRLAYVTGSSPENGKAVHMNTVYGLVTIPVQDLHGIDEFAAAKLVRERMALLVEAQLAAAQQQVNVLRAQLNRLRK